MDSPNYYIEYMNQALSTAAKEYIRKEFHPIPVQGKVPLIAWSHLREKPPTIFDVDAWPSMEKATGLALLTGKEAGFVVLDIDEGADLGDREIPHTPTARSGRGMHYYFKYPTDIEVGSYSGIVPKVDIKGDGGCIVAPPSVHENGNTYTWTISPDDAEFADLPAWLLDLLRKEGGSVEDFSIAPVSDPSGGLSEWEYLLNGVEQGRRNDSATRLTGKLLGALPPEHWESMAWPIVRTWNLRNSPPLPDKEVRGVFESIKAREGVQIAPTENLGQYLVPLAEFMTRQFPAQKYYVDGLLIQGGLNFITAPTGVGKTTLLLYLLKRMLAGEAAFETFDTVPAKVLFLNEDNADRYFQEILTRVGLQSDPNFQIISNRGLKMVKGWGRRVAEVMTANGMDLVVVDCLFRFNPGDENSTREAQWVVDELNHIERAGFTPVVIHHNRKAKHGANSSYEDMRGSSVFRDAADSHLAIKRNGEVLTISQSKNKGGRLTKPFRVELLEWVGGGPLQYRYLGQAEESHESAEDKAEAAKGEILELIRQGIADEPSLIEAMKPMGEGSVRKLLKEVVEAGALVIRRGERGRHYYSEPSA